jgi:hypothetical protein
MAITIYVASTEKLAGKTALCIGLMRWFQRTGRTVGYMKPVSTTIHIVDGRAVDEDALFIRSTLNLSDPLESMAPVLMSPDEVKAVVEGGDTRHFETRVIEAYRAVAQDRDAVILEGGNSLREGRMINLTAFRIAELLGASALVVVPYVDTAQVIDDLLVAQMLLGTSMMGGVINAVFPHRITYAEEKVKPFLERLGVPIFANLPKEKLLLSVSVRELLEGLGGEILCCDNALDDLVETLMVGAMNVEGALTYFRRASNKAVVTGGDRVDIQLVALETSTRCLILTGDLRPSPIIIGLAEERRVPIILTRYDTLKAIQTIENFFGRTRFQQQKKVEHFVALLDKWMNFDALGKALDRPIR